MFKYNQHKVKDMKKYSIATMVCISLGIAWADPEPAPKPCTVGMTSCEAKTVTGGAPQDCLPSTVKWTHGTCTGEDKDTNPDDGQQKCAEPLGKKKESYTNFRLAAKIDGTFFCLVETTGEYEVDVRCPSLVPCVDPPQE